MAQKGVQDLDGCVDSCCDIYGRIFGCSFLSLLGVCQAYGETEVVEKDSDWDGCSFEWLGTLSFLETS